MAISSTCEHTHTALFMLYPCLTGQSLSLHVTLLLFSCLSLSLTLQIMSRPSGGPTGPCKQLMLMPPMILIASMTPLPQELVSLLGSTAFLDLKTYPKNVVSFDCLFATIKQDLKNIMKKPCVL